MSPALAVEMTQDVFISYRRSDQAKAALLHRLLEERGIAAWYDAMMSAGEDWRTRTGQALVDAPVFVLLFSQSAAQSGEIVKELSAATMQKKVVIPVRLENIQPEGAFLYELASRNWFDAYEHTDERLAMLADQLTALVRALPGARSASPALAAAPDGAKPAPRRRIVTLAVALGLIVVAAGAYISLRPKHPAGGDSAPSQRVAFFGFTADDDAVSKNIAAIATDEAFVNFGALHVQTVARGDTAAAFTVPRLTRAGELGARYALSADVRRDGDQIRFAMRLEDVPTRATLWEGTADGSSTTPVPTAFVAADTVVQLTSCVATAAHTGDAPPTDAAATLVAQACGSFTTRGGRAKYTAALREILQRDLGGPDRDGAFAYFATYALHLRSPALRETWLKESIEAAERAAKSRPDSYATAAGQHAVAMATNAPPSMWIPAVERSLQQLLIANDTYWYARANRAAGSSMLASGRVHDAASYLKAAIDVEPINPSNVTAYAVAMAASGEVSTGQVLSWDALILQLMQSRPDGWTWEYAVAASIFSGSGDTERLIAMAPATLPAYVVACYRDLHAAVKLTDTAARLAAARTAEACLTQFDSPHMIMQAASMLGDLDKAFEVIDTPTKANLLVRYYYPPWFMPSTRAMRADARFLPLMEKLGYVDYWRRSGTRPDVCATDAERGIPLCAALAAR